MVKSEKAEKTVAPISAENKDVIEIPVGRYVGAMRRNPWMVVSVVLALALVFVLFFRGGSSGTGLVVSEQDAGDSLIKFINGQGQGTAEFVSAEEKDNFYQVTVKYNGQDIPVYVTMDGKYLVSDLVPLSGEQPTGTPPAPRGPVDVDLGTSPVKGSKDALVTLVEFTDYQCPFCSKFFSESYVQLVKEYVDTGKVRVVVKEFPLSFHPEAQKAAESAHCVRDQLGDAGYFRMHDLLFKNQAELGVDNEKKWARTLGVQGAKFDECLDSGKFADVVAADLDYGQTLGVTGTPAFFINGQMVEGAQPYAVFKQAIDAALAG
ncbi:MAG TPA: thioredoxin domain-containing protein [Candidatus Nanoarchaeia archaeon]|nr:thioredoxin domain-containing protein [Candidatus Nanoarchaeia archaeon]